MTEKSRLLLPVFSFPLREFFVDFLCLLAVESLLVILEFRFDCLEQVDVESRRHPQAVDHDIGEFLFDVYEEGFVVLEFFRFEVVVPQEAL